MPDRQTKRIVEVCRDTYQEEKASGLSKTGRFAGGQRLHRERKMREIFRSERCQTHEGGAGEGDLFESAWRSTGTAQQYSRLPIRSNRRGPKKSGLEGGGAEDSKKKGLSILFLGQSTHRQKADILSFPSRGRFPPTFYPITVFSSLGATKQK